MDNITHLGAVNASATGKSDRSGVHASIAARQTVVKKWQQSADTTEKAAEDTPKTGDAVKANAEALKRLTEQVNESLSQVTALRFRVDEKSDKTVVRVVDQDTQELIRQIPSENMVELARRMKDFQGVLYDKEA
jgi:flagellar protein FlaG